LVYRSFSITSATLPSELQKPDLPTDIEERIRQRAYVLYEQRSRVDGFPMDDWLQAETEIVGSRKQQQVKVAKGSK
jgi:hypothetical protein